MKNRKKLYIFIVIIIIITAVLTLFYSTFGDKSYLKIQNLTDTPLSGISIKYVYAEKEKVIEIPDLQPKDNYKMNILFPDDFTEGAIKISYIDNYGTPQEEFLVGYIEKGYYKKITVNVDSIDEDGKLSFRVQ